MQLLSNRTADFGLHTRHTNRQSRCYSCFESDPRPLLRSLQPNVRSFRRLLAVAGSGRPKQLFELQTHLRASAQVLDWSEPPDWVLERQLPSGLLTVRWDLVQMQDMGHLVGGRPALVCRWT